MLRNEDMDAFRSKLGDTLYIHQIIDCWKNRQTITKNRLPNIVFLKEDGWKASIQLRTMFAMVQQAKTNKQQIMARFHELF